MRKSLWVEAVKAGAQEGPRVVWQEVDGKGVRLSF